MECFLGPLKPISLGLNGHRLSCGIVSDNARHFMCHRLPLSNHEAQPPRDWFRQHDSDFVGLNHSPDRNRLEHLSNVVEEKIQKQMAKNDDVPIITPCGIHATEDSNYIDTKGEASPSTSIHPWCS